jgi:putative ABC transport system permease protein
MVVRGIGRDRRRSLSTVVGVVLALVLVLASWGMVDTVEVLLDRQFTEVQRQDAEVYVDGGDDDAVDAVRALAGVSRVEVVGRANVVVASDSDRYATELFAFAPSTQMHGFGATGPPSGGLVAGRALADLLDVDVGDTVTVSASGDGTASVSLPIDGFVDEPLGTLAYADPDAVGSLIDPTVMARFADGADREEMRRTITQIPGVVAYTDARALYDTAQSLLGLFYAFVGVMMAFGGLMAFALIFAMTSANAAERSAELAAMRVNGVPPRYLARMLAGENLLLTVIAIVPGLVVGVGVSAVFMDSFSSDLFDFGLQIRARTLVIAALSVAVVSVLTQWPASRMIDRLDLARVVRERSR